MLFTASEDVLAASNDRHARYHPPLADERSNRSQKSSNNPGTPEQPRRGLFGLLASGFSLGLQTRRPSG